MAGKILKGLAIAAGVGIGISLTTSARKRQPDEVLDRLDKIESRLTALETGLPAMLDSILAPRIEDLRTRLQNETQQRVDEMLAEFERNIGDAVSSRLSVLERAQLDFISTVERLSVKDLGFQAQLDAALKS